MADDEKVAVRKDRKPVYVLGVLGLEGVLTRTIELPWSPADDKEFVVSWRAAREEYPGKFKTDRVEDEEGLLEFVRSCDTDEADWFLLRFGTHGPTLLERGFAYYRPGIVEPPPRPGPEAKMIDPGETKPKPKKGKKK